MPGKPSAVSLARTDSRSTSPAAFVSVMQTCDMCLIICISCMSMIELEGSFSAAWMHTIPSGSSFEIAEDKTSQRRPVRQAAANAAS